MNSPPAVMTGSSAAGVAHEIDNTTAFASSILFALVRYLEAYATLKQKLLGKMSAAPLTYRVQ